MRQAQKQLPAAKNIQEKYLCLKNRVLHCKLFLFSGIFLLAVSLISGCGENTEKTPPKPAEKTKPAEKQSTVPKTDGMNDGADKASPAAKVPGVAPHDIDGNGISDILVRQTTPEFLIGFWKDGMTKWSCTNILHKENWKIPGTYDMDGNGKADLVVVGTTGEGEKKTIYAGFYKDGIDKDENWVNIGNLPVSEGDDWQCVVGNLSDMKDYNSIVWYSAKRGKLGVWLNGTDQWVELSGNLNKQWSLIGCGDFEGQGKKSILMSFRGGSQYFVINLEGRIKVFGSPGATWRVCAIGDFDGKGKDSVLFFHPEQGLVAKYAGGLFGALEQKGQLDASDWKVIGSGRYSGAPAEDILVRQISTGKVGYYTGGDMSKWHEVGTLGKEWVIIP